MIGDGGSPAHSEGSLPGGVVRAARRPDGWVAPGPAPAGFVDDSCRPGHGEDLCHLCGDWRLLQRVDGHRWSLDDLVTAWVAVESTPAPRTFCDIGCGIGSVLSMVAWAFPEASGVGIEAQAISVDLARRSLRYNGADRRVAVLYSDLRAETASGRTFELVTGTPPYFPPGTATASSAIQKGPCRIEQRGGVEDYCAAATRLLADGGTFVMCAGTGLRRRVEEGVLAVGLGVVDRLEVIPRLSKPPLFDVYTVRRKGDVVSGVHTERALVVRDHHGQWTEAFREVRTRMGIPAEPPTSS